MTIHLLHQLLSESVFHYADRIAVTFKDKSLTYAELEIKSNQTALMLSQQGIQKGDRVGILLSKCIESIVSIFGIMKAGAIYVPLDPSAPATRIGHIIAHCGIELIITTPGALSQISSVPQASGSLKKALLTTMPKIDTTGHRSMIECQVWDTLANLSLDSYGPVEIPDSCPAYILHTSGSTGVPKGVVISHLNALTFVNMAVDFFKINAHDRIANHAPIHFDLSVFDIFGAIKSGATIVLVPEFLSTFPAKLAEFIDQERISIWNSVSSVLTMLAERGKLDRFAYNALRLIHFSGDIMPVKYLRLLIKNIQNAEFFNIYGQTEANSSLYYPVRDIPDNDVWKIPIGKPFPNFEVFGLNEANEVIRRCGEEGELYVNSSTVALGYWNAEKMTLEKFVDDPRHHAWKNKVYKTGDVVRIDEDDNYIFIGRRDHMIKSRGYRIEISEIELALNGHPNISQALVIAVPDEITGNKIVALILLIEGVKTSADELTAYCHHSLPHYMVPEEILFIDALSRTTTGKMDRKLMTDFYLSKVQTPKTS
jgi:amino acid adenylation domain-containing protein